MIWLSWLLSACGGASDAPNDPMLAPSADSAAVSTPPATTTTAVGWPWADRPCDATTAPDDAYAAAVARFEQLDDLAAPPTDGLVVTGSSSVRRWEGAIRTLSAHEPIQRGFGGARLADVAAYVDGLVLRHRPAAALVFAGTNDLADGRSVDEVLTAYRCLADRLHSEGVPLLWIGITPTPARWSDWDRAATVNAEVARLAALHPDLHYVDVPTPFLATGSPPDSSLFVDDQLHLSVEGYALWESVVAEVVDAALEPIAAPSAPPVSGTLLRVDLGPSNPEDGTPTPPIDAFGIHWNAWHDVEGDAQILAGEALRGLVDTNGNPTRVALTVAGGFRSNGLQNGGLATPSGDLLATMAVPEATSDFFYTGHADDPGGLAFSGLDPDVSHTLRLFASRADPERRVTRYVVHGEATHETTLVTSGSGSDGANANVGTVAVLNGLRPDAWGRLHVDVQIAEGSYAYISLLELQVD